MLLHGVVLEPIFQINPTTLFVGTTDCVVSASAAQLIHFKINFVNNPNTQCTNYFIDLNTLSLYSSGTVMTQPDKLVLNAILENSGAYFFVLWERIWLIIILQLMMQLKQTVSLH